MSELRREETVKNTSVFSVFTIFSRFFGLIRDSLKAFAFGTSPFAVAFDIAFRLPNMLRNLVAEGALSQSFIPIYEQYRGDNSKERKASGVVIAFMFASLSLFTLLAWIIIPWLMPLLTHNMNNQQELNELIIQLSQILFPYILLMSIASIYMAIQYSHGIFWAGALGPALLNIVIIVVFGGSLFIFHLFYEPLTLKKLVVLFSGITLFAGGVQLFFQMRVVKRLNLSPRIHFDFKHPIIKSLFVLMLPAVFGAAVQEIGQLIDIYLATSLIDVVPGAVAALSYGHRLIHLPMGIFGVAISTASLPQLSRLFKEKDKNAFIDTLWTTVGLNFFLIIPAILGLIIFAEPIIGFLFEHGQFSKESTRITAVALIFYAPGILGFSLQKLFMSSMYARKNSKTPAIITAFVLVVNISLSLVFMKYLYHAGLALGSSIASYIGTLLYLIQLRNDGYFSWNRKNGFNLLKIVLVNVIFLAFLLTIKSLTNELSYGVMLLIVLPFAATFYIFLSYAVRLSEMTIFIQIIKSIRNSKR